MKLERRKVACIVTLANGPNRPPFAIEAYPDIRQAEAQRSRNARVLVTLIVIDPTHAAYCRPRVIANPFADEIEGGSSGGSSSGGCDG